jgi:hypothetical protein
MDAIDHVDVDSFCSPRKKLLRFFRSSRDRWKEKYMRAKRELKLMGNQVRAVENSREIWKQRYRAERQENAALRRELEELKRTDALAP